MSVRNAPISSPLLIAMLLPIVMWIAAAGITWLVVDRLMVYPLRRLRANVSAYRPGETIDMDVIRSNPSQAIRELGEAFRKIGKGACRERVCQYVSIPVDTGSLKKKRNI